MAGPVRGAVWRPLTLAGLGDYSVNLCLCRVPRAGVAGFGEVELFLQQEHKAHVVGGWQWNCQGGWRDDVDVDAFCTAAREAAEEIGVACDGWQARLEARLRSAYIERDPCLRSRVYVCSSSALCCAMRDTSTLCTCAGTCVPLRPVCAVCLCTRSQRQEETQP